MPKISVVIPVYNAKVYLPRCLEALMGQMFRDIEIILVDDGSTDGSSYVCNEYAQLDHRIKVRHKSNGGPSSARNEGIRVAGGDLLYLCDADDVVDSQALVVLYQAYQKERADFVLGDFRRLLPGGSMVARLWQHEETFLASDEIGLLLRDFLRDQTNNAILRTAWGRLYKLDILRKHGLLFREDIKVYEDTLFSLEYLSRCHSLRYVPKFLYTLHHDQQNIASGFVCEEPFSFQYALDFLREYLIGKGYSPDEIERDYGNSYIKYSIRSIYNIINRTPLWHLRRLLRCIGDMADSIELQTNLHHYYHSDPGDIVEIPKYLRNHQIWKIVWAFKKQAYMKSIVARWRGVAR